MKKLFLALCAAALATISAQATVLLRDSTNYPYTNGPIAGQGQWYVYSPATPANDVLVSSNVIYMTTTNKDTIATPTNGYYSADNGTIVYASFTINVSKLPGFDNYNGGYFAQFVSTNKNTCCNLFISTNGTVIPGTFRLSIANFSVSFSNLQQPVTYPEDLSTNVTYNIVIAYDSAVGSVTEGANLLINPSQADYDNLINGFPEGYGFVYGTDIAINAARANIENTALTFSPYISAGISNVIVGTTFADVYTQPGAPVFGLQPESGTNYAGNSATFYAVAGGSDLSYQWYSTTYGKLTDGASYTGSTSNILVVNSLTASDGYYVVATDANDNSATSATAWETVNTTATPVFFDPSLTPTNVVANLFNTVTLADTASGTGPITYQWYFQPIAITNVPVYSFGTKNTYTTNSGVITTNVVVTSNFIGNTIVYYTNGATPYVPLSGQTSPSINVTLSDYSVNGFYYVVASNPVNGGTSAFGPTNAIHEIAPSAATIDQLHVFLNNSASQVAANPGGTVYLNTNNITVSGYASSYRGYGSSYTTFFLLNSNGFGVEVFLAGKGNTNAPGVGSYVTVSGPLEVYHGELEMVPSSQSAIVTNEALPFTLSPFVANSLFADFSTNGVGSNALRYAESLVTFTNVYLYGSSSGGAFGTGGANSGVGGIFTSNSYCVLYITVGAPYDAVTNSHTMEIFQPTYDYKNADGTPKSLNPFDYKLIPTHCTQLTGVIQPYGGTPSYVEIIPSRYEDYVTTTPLAFGIAAAVTNKAATVSWAPVTGQTYSVYSSTNLQNGWKTEAFGLTYYPTNGTFSQTTSSNVPVKFFRVTTP